MADSKLTALSATTSPATSDIVYVVTDPGTTPASKKVTLANLSTAIAAPKTAKYVTTAADGTLSAEVVIPGMAGHADILGAAAGGISEDYDTVTTGLTWDVAPATEDSNTTVKSHLYLVKSTTSTSLGVRAWTPGAGAFDARTKIAIGTDATTGSGEIGLYIQNSDASVRAVIRYWADTTNNRNAFDVFTYASSSYTQRGATIYTVGNPAVYLRITRDGSNNLTFWYSMNGILWQKYVTQALTLTVSHVGYYFNQDGGSTIIYAISDWLRTDH